MVPSSENELKHLSICIEKGKESVIFRVDAVHDTVPWPEPEFGHHDHIKAAYVKFILHLGHFSSGEWTDFAEFAVVTAFINVEMPAVLQEIHDYADNAPLIA